MFKYQHTNGYFYVEVGPRTNREMYCKPLPGQGLDDTPRFLKLESLRLSESEGDLPEALQHFQVGDIVRLKTGTAPIQVTEATAYWVSGTYLKSKAEIYLRKANDFVLYEEATTQGKDTMNTLYQFTADKAVKYGTYLATNSSGMYVMEEKGTGSIFTVDKSTVEEVLPYTIGVKFLGSSTTYSYFANPETFKVGELYLMEAPSGLCLVNITDLNTKSKSATKDFKPISKIQAVPVDNN